MQAVVAVQDTDPSAESVLPAGVGVAKIDHAAPFHRSANVLDEVVNVPTPTATHHAADVHERPESAVLELLVGLGVVRMDQVRPFQRSLKAVSVNVRLAWWPTATHAVADLQLTALRLLPIATVDPVTRQEVPFHASMSGPRSLAPTAVHVVAEIHDTPSRSTVIATTGKTGGLVIRQPVPFQTSANGVSPGVP
jgi:hypothetical protein